jgi:hypothetical protein
MPCADLGMTGEKVVRSKAMLPRGGETSRRMTLADGLRCNWLIKEALPPTIPVGTYGMKRSEVLKALTAENTAPGMAPGGRERTPTAERTM